MRLRPRSVLGSAVVAGALALSGCVTPAPTDSAYAGKARVALESAVSETSTAQMAVDVLHAGRSTNAYADTVVTDSENAMGGIQSVFGSVDPPGGLDPFREDVLTLLGDAQDAVAHARLAVRRSDRAGLMEAHDELVHVRSRLEAAQEHLP